MSNGNEIWAKVKEGIDAMGDMLLSIVDSLGSAVQSKAVGILGGLGSGVSSGLSSARSGLVGSITPNAPSISKSNSGPSMAGPSKSQEISAPSKPSNDLDGMLKSAGFSMDSISSGFEAENVTEIGCASYQAPRVNQVSQAMLLQR